MPKKASDKVGMYGCGIVSLLIREENGYFEELFQNSKKSVSQLNVWFHNHLIKKSNKKPVTKEINERKCSLLIKNSKKGLSLARKKFA